MDKENHKDQMVYQDLAYGLHLNDLEDGKLLDGDSEAPLSPPENFDMAKFHRGRQFFRDHLFSCSTAMFFSLVIGMSVPELLEALVFTQGSDTREKALKRYVETFHHVALWHYGNVWEKDSKAQLSICEVRQMHKKVREKMQRNSQSRKFLSQYDMGLVQSGFMGAVIMYPDDIGISCSLSELEDYVYFWYGIGHLLGILRKYNICGHGLSQALAFCKDVEQDIVSKNLENPPPEFEKMTTVVLDAFQHNKSLTLLTFPVISALSYELMSSKTGNMSFGDTVRYLLWKLIFFSVKHFSWFKTFLHNKMQRIFGLTFIYV